jgi:hypothetical protein
MDGPSSSGGDVASFIDDRVRQRQQVIPIMFTFLVVN